LRKKYLSFTRVKILFQKKYLFHYFFKDKKVITNENTMSLHPTNTKSKKRQASSINPNINDDINQHVSSKRTKLKATNNITSEGLNREQSHKVHIEPQVSNFSISDMYVETYI